MGADVDDLLAHTKTSQNLEYQLLKNSTSLALITDAKDHIAFKEANEVGGIFLKSIERSK